MKSNPTTQRVRERIADNDEFRAWVSKFMTTKRYGSVFRVRKIAKQLYQEIVKRRTKNESQGLNQAPE